MKQEVLYVRGNPVTNSELRSKAEAAARKLTVMAEREAQTASASDHPPLYFSACGQTLLRRITPLESQRSDNELAILASVLTILAVRNPNAYHDLIGEVLHISQRMGPSGNRLVGLSSFLLVMADPNKYYALDIRENGLPAIRPRASAPHAPAMTNQSLLEVLLLMISGEGLPASSP